MVRVYSQPGQYQPSSLGGLFNEDQSDRRIDYERAEREKAPKLNDAQEQGYGSTALQKQIESLSEALSRLQDISGGSQSLPSSALSQQEQSRKTWSAPNKDPFGPGRDLTNLADPMGRRQQQSNPSSGYVPSFGSGNPPRYRRGGGNAPPPGLDREAYLKTLQLQIEEQEERKRRDRDNRDWWEKSEPVYQPTDQPKSRITQKEDLDNPDHRRQYEIDLKNQMEYKKSLEDAIKAKEKEEELKLERRTIEQQEKMKREFEEEMTRKRAKEEAKLKRQEELMKRQSELQKEIAAKKKQENEQKLVDKRGGREPRVASVQPRESRSVRSPPIPTLRDKDGSSAEGSGNRSEARTPVGSRTPGEGSEETNDELLNQLSEMRKGLERRRDQMQESQQSGSKVWNGLEE